MFVLVCLVMVCSCVCAWICDCVACMIASVCLSVSVCGHKPQTGEKAFCPGLGGRDGSPLRFWLPPPFLTLLATRVFPSSPRPQRHLPGIEPGSQAHSGLGPASPIQMNSSPFLITSLAWPLSLLLPTVALWTGSQIYLYLLLPPGSSYPPPCTPQSFLARPEAGPL